MGVCNIIRVVNRTMTGYTTGTANELTQDTDSTGTWTYAYDGEGNTISKRNTSTGEVWSFGYDNDNRMVTAKDVSGAGTTMTLATYIWDAMGNQIEEDVWTHSSGTTTVTRFGYDGDQVWADLRRSNALQTGYIRGDEVDQLFARIASEQRRLVPDRLAGLRAQPHGCHPHAAGHHRL